MTHVSNYAIAAILCLQTVCRCVISTVGQYIYASYLQIYSSNDTQTLPTNTTNSFYHLNTVSKQCMNTSNSNAQLWAQEQSADLFFRIDLWNSCPMIIMTYILGLYTPKLGRRCVLILPMLGTLGQLSIWLAIIYFHLADYWWYIGSFIVGLSGSNNILNFVLSLIITDNTNENERSSRFVYFEALTTAVSAIITFAIGYYINWRGFTDLYWISLGLQIISILIVIYFFKNSSSSIMDERTSLLSSSNQITTDENVQIKESHFSKTKCGDCLNILKVFSFKNRSRKKSISLLLTLFAYIFYLLAYSTYASFLWYLLDTPFCWSSENVGNYIALSSICCAIFSVLGMKLLTYIHANDAIICTLSHLFFAISSLWIAFARHSWQLYAGLLISPYADYQNSLTLPMISKWLEPHERSNAFTFVTEVNTIITTFGDSFFNWVYSRTVVKQRNFVLLLAVGFSIVSFILNICLIGVIRRMSEGNSTSGSDSPPLLLPNNDVVCSSPRSISPPQTPIVKRSGTNSPHSISPSQTPIVERSRTNSQSSIDKEILPTVDLLVL